MQHFRKVIAVVLVFTVLGTSSSVWGAPRSGGQSVASAGPRKHLQTIVFAGLAGAILGLSTLSFYGRPQDKLSNIAVGFAIGVITGTVYSTYKAATEPKDFYSLREVGPNAELWAMDINNRVEPSSSLTGTTLTFEF